MKERKEWLEKEKDKKDEREKGRDYLLCRPVGSGAGKVCINEEEM